MSDTNLDPRSLTKEAKSLVQAIPLHFGFQDELCAWVRKVDGTLFGEPASEPAKVECQEEGKWTGNVKCPDCGRLVNEAHCGGPNHVYQRVKPTQPEPVAAEMPEAVAKAAELLRQYAHESSLYPGSRYFRESQEQSAAADALESFWRTHAAQPAKVRMTPALDTVLDFAQETVNMLPEESWNASLFPKIQGAIHEVRAQAAEAGKVRMPKVRELIELCGRYGNLLLGLGYFGDSHKLKIVAFAALAELDAAEGVKG